MNKKIWVIANWKSNKNISEALDWISKVGLDITKKDNLKVVVCPTFSVLSEVKKAITIGNFPIIVGSQDLSPFGNGAFTGEESASLLKDLVSLSILGHSERRQNFSETDETVANKVTKALENNITPLVCIQGPDTPIPDGCKLVAYEPLFAIGTGNPDTPQNANSVAKQLRQRYGQDLEVIYGGSVVSENVEAFIMQEEISGILLGKASLDPDEFLGIIKTLEG